MIAYGFERLSILLWFMDCFDYRTVQCTNNGVTGCRVRCHVEVDFNRANDCAMVCYAMMDERVSRREHAMNRFANWFRHRCERTLLYLFNLQPCAPVASTAAAGIIIGYKWKEWSDWQPCSELCGEGVQRRWRYCISGLFHLSTKNEESFTLI